MGKSLFALVLLLVGGCSKSVSAASGDGTSSTAAPGSIEVLPKDLQACDFTVDDCTAKCSAGNQASCYRLGRLFNSVYLDTHQSAKADDLYAKACAAKNGDACNAVGVGVRSSGDLPGSLPWFERGCGFGSAKSCVNAGLFRARWRGMTDPVKARDLFRRGCAQDQALTANACTEFGVLLAEDGDNQGAITALTRGCERGYSTACTHLARLSPTTSPPKPTADAQAVLRAAACDEGDGDACLNVGARLQRGANGPPDLTGALKAFERGCALGGANACLQLATILLDGKEGFPVDPVRSARAANAACQMAHETNQPLLRRGCRMYADQLSSGRGVAQDVAAATALYIETCEDAPPFGCDEGGRALLEGTAIGVDHARGLNLLRLGCSKQDKASCALLAKQGGDAKEITDAAKAEEASEDRRYCDVQGVAAYCTRVGMRLASANPPDLAGAVTYFTRACTAGDVHGCTMLAKRPDLGVSPEAMANARRRACVLGDKGQCDKAPAP